MNIKTPTLPAMDFKDGEKTRENNCASNEHVD